MIVLFTCHDVLRNDKQIKLVGREAIETKIAKL